MKKAVFILLLVFACSQLIPALQFLAGNQKAFCMVADEEKTGDKGKEEIKKDVQKFMHSFLAISFEQLPGLGFYQKNDTCLSIAYLETLTQPPNFS